MGISKQPKLQREPDLVLSQNSGYERLVGSHHELYYELYLFYVYRTYYISALIWNVYSKCQEYTNIMLK